MLKVLIVDDEILVRANIKMLLDWEAHGFVLCGEASNGREALAQIDRQAPDIVLLDIKMPLMDGYELSSVISQTYKSVKMIVLSNYDDFELVKGTFKNGVVDYLLKHNLNKGLLLDALTRTREAIESTRLSRSPELHIPNNIMALREKFVLQLIASFYVRNEEIQSQLDLLEIRLDSRNILPIVMEVDEYESNPLITPSSLKDKSLLDFAIMNITGELLSEHKNGIVTHIAENQFLILISHGAATGEAQMHERTYTVLNKISSCLHKFLEVTVSYGVGKLCNNFTDIPNSYDYGVKCLKNRFFTGKGSVVSQLATGSEKAIKEDLTGLSLSDEKQILNYLKSGDTLSLTKVLEELFSHIRASSYTVNGCRMIFYDLLNIIIKVCKEKDVEFSVMFERNQTPQEMVAKIQSIDGLRDWILPFFLRLSSMNAAEAVPDASPYVKKALLYIKKNYARPISLSDAADEANIASTYLSKLFKDEMGIGFSEYLSNTRIDKAKTLLAQKKHDLKEIMELCGFYNYDYFIKAFKKKVGVTPGKFLNSVE